MKPIDVLFLCETNAATSLIAEALVNHRSDPRYRAFSAGRIAARAVLPEARQALVSRGIDAEVLEPKPWSIFALPGAPRPDLVVDLAAVSWTIPDLMGLIDRESGWPSTALVHWPLRDPSLVDTRSERRAVAGEVLETLQARLDSQLFSKAPAQSSARGVMPSLAAVA